MDDEPRIYSRRKGATPAPPDAVYVGRGTPWGNPYEMLNEAFRDTVCNMFANYAAERLKREPDWLTPLRGKSLMCWCKNAPDSNVRCHAETLLRLANPPMQPTP